MTPRPAILSIAFPFAPVGPPAVGGAEVILSQLEASLPAFGFRSVVVAHASSQPGGTLYPVAVPPGEITPAVREQVTIATQAGIDRALAEHPVALVHMHGLDFDRYRLPAELPVLVTLHLPPGWYPETVWDLPANYSFVCVSETQRRSCPQRVQDRITVIGNGVPLPPASTLRAEGRYALMLARICEEKNLHTGLQAAKLAGMPAVLAGEVFPYEAHQRYFAEQIEPRLTRSGAEHASRNDRQSAAAEARFLGPVTGAAKARLLARAACLLVPSLAPETSCLVAMEALAAGVPVIAMASGAIPEIVADGRTGILVPPGAGPGAAQAMAEAIGRLPSISREACRTAAAERFTLHRMLEGYAGLYRRLALPLAAVHDCRVTPSTPAPPEPHAHGAETSPGESLLVEEITSSAALDALAGEWAELWRADGRATPFQHPAWLVPWWRQFGPDGELHALALRTSANGGLCGFLPSYVYTEPAEQQRKLLLLGAGTTDYLDGVWSPSCPQGAAAAIEYIQGAMPCWDVAHLAQLRPETPLVLAAGEHGVSTHPAEPTSLLHLASPLPAKVRANAGRYRRRAQAQGELVSTLAATPDEALRCFDDLLRFHRERWDGSGDAGVLSDPHVQGHHREALPALLAEDLLCFFRLTLNGELMGVLYALADPPARAERSLYLYLIGFDTRFADLSPGTLLLHEVWQYARDHGFSRLDLLRGGETYKQLWGASPHPTVTAVLSPRG